MMDEHAQRALTSGSITTRDAITTPTLLWPDGIVYFVLDEGLGMTNEPCLLSQSASKNAQL